MRVSVTLKKKKEMRNMKDGRRRVREKKGERREAEWGGERERERE